AQIYRLRIREHANRATRAEDHPRARSSAAASANDRLSMRKPEGDTILSVRVAIGSGTIVTGTSARACFDFAPALQRSTVPLESPSASERSAIVAPAARWSQIHFVARSFKSRGKQGPRRRPSTLSSSRRNFSASRCHLDLRDRAEHATGFLSGRDAAR